MFTRNESSMIEFLQHHPQELFAKVPNQTEEVPVQLGRRRITSIVTEAFAQAIRTGSGSPLIAAGPEGIRGLSLGNAIMLSSWRARPSNCRLDEDLYEKTNCRS